jgi:hypothetical protein
MKSFRFEEYDRNRESWCLKVKERNHKLKEEVMRHYSPELKCQRCGFSDIRALSIDHIDGKGAEHRRQLGIIRGHGGRSIYIWLKKNNFPVGFQILCMNCQWIKRAENNEGKVDTSPEKRKLRRVTRLNKRLKELDEQIKKLELYPGEADEELKRKGVSP